MLIQEHHNEQTMWSLWPPTPAVITCITEMKPTSVILLPIPILPKQVSTKGLNIQSIKAYITASFGSRCAQLQMCPRSYDQPSILWHIFRKVQAHELPIKLSGYVAPTKQPGKKLQTFDKQGRHDWKWLKQSQSNCSKGQKKKKNLRALLCGINSGRASAAVRTKYD